MTVALVILMFATFIAIDALLARRRAAVGEAIGEPAVERPFAHALAPPVQFPIPEPVWVSGYQLPAELHYHRGHTWMRVLDADTALVGLDDFARRLIGQAHHLRLPAVGDRVKQGLRAFSVDTDGGREREVGLVSPVDGEVLEINPRLAERPDLATEEPYGRGWLFKVRNGALAGDINNLLSGSLARRWTEDSRERLELELMALSGSVLQDGGEPVADFARELPDDDWRRLVGEFLLT